MSTAKISLVGLGVGIACLLGCDAPGVAFESTFPTVVCENGGQRRVRVYGHGFEEGSFIEATFGDADAQVTRIDDFTLDVELPDVTLSADRFPWDAHDLFTGELGLYRYLDDVLEPVAWDVLITRSQLSPTGAPEFKDLDDNELQYRAVPIENIVVGYDDVLDEYGEVIGVEPVVIPGSFNVGYFTTGAPWVDAEGNPLGECDGGTEDYIGDFCYEPLYYNEGGQPLLYDASDIASFFLDYYAPWDPYLYKGAYYTEADGEEYLFYYDGRDNETDYARGDLYNQSFGAFFTLDLLYVYTDGAGTIVTFERPPDDTAGLSYVGVEVTGVANQYYPGIIPITHSVDLVFDIAGSEAGRLESPIGLISREFDYSWFYTLAPYYDFTEYKGVDLNEDGEVDEFIPVDGSWGCVWLSL